MHTKRNSNWARSKNEHLADDNVIYTKKATLRGFFAILGRLHMHTFAISQTTRKPYPKLPYQKIKEDILGKNYELSLMFVGGIKAQQLNKAYRKKTYVPNVLSFPLAKDAGEIFITPEVAKKEAHKFSMTVTGYIGFLFIHGCLHLKGHLHGDTMDKAEQKYCRKYKLR